MITPKFLGHKTEHEIMIVKSSIRDCIEDLR